DYGENALMNKERMLQKGSFTLLPGRLELRFENRATMLTKKEADIIETLMVRHRRVVGHEALLEKVWDDKAFVDENTLNVNMTRVRKKFQELGIPDAVETVRGMGYRLRVT